MAHSCKRRVAAMLLAFFMVLSTAFANVPMVAKAAEAGTPASYATTVATSGDSDIESFDSSANGWEGVEGENYGHGDADVKNAKPEVTYNKEDKSLNVGLDYSANASDKWSEARISKDFDTPVSIAGKKYIGYEITYPASLDGEFTSKFVGKAKKGETTADATTTEPATKDTETEKTEAEETEATEQKTTAKVTTEQATTEADTEEHDGIYVKGSKLYDGSGKELVMRGVNVTHAWKQAYTEDSIKKIAELGANAVRVCITNGTSWEDPTSVSELQQIINWCKAEGMICVLDVQDTTGNDCYDESEWESDMAAKYKRCHLQSAVDYWSDSEVVNLVNANKDYVIVNIANEWYGTWEKTCTQYENGYKKAVAALRTAGIENVIMVDAPGYAQDVENMVKAIPGIQAADPTGQIMFSIHAYASAAKDEATVTSNMNAAIGSGACICIGEFGWYHSGVRSAFEKLMEVCADENIGTFAWSWGGNEQSAGDMQLDMVDSLDTMNLSAWGTQIFGGEYGIQATSKMAYTGKSYTGTKVSVQELEEPTTEEVTTREAEDVTIDINPYLFGGEYEGEWFLTQNGAEEKDAQKPLTATTLATIATGGVRMTTDLTVDEYPCVTLYTEKDGETLDLSKAKSISILLRNNSTAAITIQPIFKVGDEWTWKEPCKYKTVLKNMTELLTFEISNSDFADSDNVQAIILRMWSGSSDKSIGNIDLLSCGIDVDESEFDDAIAELNRPSHAGFYTWSEKEQESTFKDQTSSVSCEDDVIKVAFKNVTNLAAAGAQAHTVPGEALGIDASKYKTMTATIKNTGSSDICVNALIRTGGGWLWQENPGIVDGEYELDRVIKAGETVDVTYMLQDSTWKTPADDYATYTNPLTLMDDLRAVGFKIYGTSSTAVSGSLEITNFSLNFGETSESTGGSSTTEKTTSATKTTQQTTEATTKATEATTQATTSNTSYVGKGMYVDGTKLYTADGSEFVMRGVNYAYCWFTSRTIADIKKGGELGSNTARVVLGLGQRSDWDDYGHATTQDEVEAIIEACRESGQICVLELHDPTGQDDTNWISECVKYWKNLKDTLNANKDYVILNIANEWMSSGGNDTYKNTYVDAVKSLRDAGIENVIMIDAPGWGQDAGAIASYGPSIKEADSTGNIMFSVHFYSSSGKDESTIKSSLDNARNQGLCTIAGEFGWTHSGTQIPYQYIMKHCNENNIGYISWSWTGNGGSDYVLDLVDRDSGELTDWGKGVFEGKDGVPGIKETAKKPYNGASTGGSQTTTEATTQTTTSGGSSSGGSSSNGGMYVDGSKLYTATGQEVVMRGANMAHCFESGRSSNDLQAMSALGANAVRIVLSSGQTAPAGWSAGKNTQSDIEPLVQYCKANGMVAVLDDQTTTGGDDTGYLNNAVNYWLEMKDFLNKYKDCVILNIANEWMGGWIGDYEQAAVDRTSVYKDAYVSAVKKLRDAGIENVIMVDAPGWGQDINGLADFAAEAILAADPNRNVMFSGHMYCYGAPDEAGVKERIDNYTSKNLCFVVGEFGWKHQYDGASRDIPYQYIMSYAQQNCAGWLAWSWYGNGAEGNYLAQNELDLVYSDNSLKGDWGNNVAAQMKGATKLTFASNEKATATSTKLASAKAASVSSAADVTISTNSLYVEGNKMYDGNGNEFIMKGVNIPHAWYTARTEQAISDAAKLGANTARIVLAEGTKYTKTTKEEVTNIINWCKENKMICVLELHDFTGDDSAESITQNAVNYWTEIKDLLNANKNYVVVNIANEWQGTWGQDTLWADTYKTAIKKLRDNGIENMIMVDASGYGQESVYIERDCKEVLNADPDKNTAFSIHIYSVLGTDAETIKSVVDNVLANDVCLVVGEFGFWQNFGEVDERTVVDYCTQKDVGWLAWSWAGNGGYDQVLDMFSAKTWSTDDITDWGKFVFYGKNGIQETAKLAYYQTGYTGEKYTGEVPDSVPTPDIEKPTITTTDDTAGIPANEIEGKTWNTGHNGTIEPWVAGKLETLENGGLRANNIDLSQDKDMTISYHNDEGVDLSGYTTLDMVVRNNSSTAAQICLILKAGVYTDASGGTYAEWNETKSPNPLKPNNGNNPYIEVPGGMTMQISFLIQTVNHPEDLDDVKDIVFRIQAGTGEINGPIDIISYGYDWASGKYDDNIAEINRPKSASYFTWDYPESSFQCTDDATTGINGDVITIGFNGVSNGKDQAGGIQTETRPGLGEGIDLSRCKAIKITATNKATEDVHMNIIVKNGNDWTWAENGGATAADPVEGERIIGAGETVDIVYYLTHATWKTLASNWEYTGTLEDLDDCRAIAFKVYGGDATPISGTLEITNFECLFEEPDLTAPATTEQATTKVTTTEKVTTQAPTTEKVTEAPTTTEKVTTEATTKATEQATTKVEVTAEATTEAGTSGETVVLEKNGQLYEAAKVYNEETDTYTVLVYAEVGDVESLDTLTIGLAGQETDFKGTVSIDNIRLFDKLPAASGDATTESQATEDKTTEDKTSTEQTTTTGKTEDGSVDKTEDKTSTDKTEDATSVDKTEDKTSTDKTEDKTSTDKTEDKTSTDKTEDKTSTDKTEDKTEGTTVNKTEDVTEDKTEGTTENKTEDKTEGTTVNKTEDVIEDKTEGTTENKTEDVTSTQQSGTTENTTSEVVKVEKIKLSTDSLSLKVGNKAQLVATVVPDNATDKTLTYESSNDSVATVDAKGNVTAKSAGMALITVTSADGKKSASCEVRVEKENSDVAVEDIVLNKSDVELTIGESVTLTTTISPSDATNKSVTWLSTSDVVSVKDGVVTALKEGNAVIIATTVDGGKTAYCNVKVTATTGSETTDVTEVKLSKTAIDLAVGDAERLQAIVLPADAAQTVVWSSSNSDVAKVDTAGVVTAKKAGQTIITAISTVDPDKYAECVVTVTQDAVSGTNVAVDNVVLNIDTTTLNVGKTANLIATVFPTNATNKSVAWSTDNASVATVNDGVVTAKAVGTATITVVTLDGAKKATCKITVVKTTETVEVTGVSVADKEVELKVGETKSLTATVTPSNATDTSYTWTSLNPEVATVTADGKLIAVAEGSAVVTVTTTDGAHRAYVVVKVKAGEESTENTSEETTTLKLSSTKVELTEGETKSLTATVTPANATVTWESNDTTIATVDKNGKITAVKAGVTSIVAKTADKTEVCTVVVKAKTTQTTQTTQTTTVNVTGISVNVSDTLTMPLSKTKTVKATVIPSNATDKKVTFTSSNKSVAAVTSAGKITSVAPGIAVITVKAGNVSKKITVKVKPAKVTSIKAKKVSSTKIKLTWKKQSKVTGYKVYRLNTKTNKYKLYKITKRNYVSVANLKKNTTYKFKVKAYKRSGSKVVNGDASKVYNVKMK